MISETRPVKLRTIYEVARRKPILFNLGVTWLLGGIFVGFSIMSLPNLDEEIPDVDHERISKLGQATNGVVTGIKILSNITINDEHPSIISYQYQSGGVNIESKFKTLAPDVVSHLSVGDSIRIKHLDGQSTIANMEPFEFNLVGLMLILPGAFLIAGLAMSLYVFYFTRHEILLYKYGKIATAEVLSATRTRPRLFSNRHDFSVVNYQYKGFGGHTYITETSTKDVSLANTIKSGDTIKIFVSPIDESKSTLIPKLEIARNNWKID